MKLIAEEALLSIAKDVTLENGAKHRCIDATQLHELPKTNIVNCPGCVYKKACIHTMNGVDPDGFCKWGETVTMFCSVKE